MNGRTFHERLVEAAGLPAGHGQFCDSERITQSAVIEPFLEQVLGWQFHDPQQVVPEYTADFGVKRGEKVDYALLVDRKPVILIETKRFDTKLTSDHVSQLFRYIVTTRSAHFGILTNGNQYQFFADTEEIGVMDREPFFEFDLSSGEIGEDAEETLMRFTRARFEVEPCLALARELRLETRMLSLLRQQSQQPSRSILRAVMGELDDGTVTDEMLQRGKLVFRSLMLRGFPPSAKERSLPSQPSPRFRLTIGDWSELHVSYRAAVHAAWKRLDEEVPGFLKRWADSGERSRDGKPYLARDAAEVSPYCSGLDCHSGVWYVPSQHNSQALASYLARSCEANGRKLGEHVRIDDLDAEQDQTT